MTVRAHADATGAVVEALLAAASRCMAIDMHDDLGAGRGAARARIDALATTAAIGRAPDNLIEPPDAMGDSRALRK